MASDLQETMLEQMLDPVTRCLTAESARQLVELRAAPNVQSRVDELARKANEAALTEDERAEYEMYVVAGSLIGVLQAKARRILSGQSAA